MKVLSFIEWVKKQMESPYAWYDRHIDFMNTTFKVADFYNQKFDVGMLVNPIAKPDADYYGDIHKEDRDKWTNDYGNWQQAESLRYFEGWEITDKSTNGNGMDLCFNHKITGRLLNNDTVITFMINEIMYVIAINVTLDFFIQQCEHIGIELQWSNHNQKVKELGL